MRRALLLLLLTTPVIAADADLPRPVADADYRSVDPAQAALGRLLFYDPILSGNREVACATCHHPRFGTGDGLPLGIGDGGRGLGPDRIADAANAPERRIPRNAPALFNLGAHEFTVLFHDGRIEVDPSRPSGLRTPMGTEMEEGFASLLSAQTMFPVLSGDEMAGHYGENEVSKAVRTGIITGEGGAWDLLSARVRAIPEFEAMFADAFPGRPITFTAISDAVAAFMEAEWRSDGSSFDAHLRGERPLDGKAAEGMALFYGEAGCAACHSGPFQTDHSFHAMGTPQIGPGKAERFERHARDTGRMRVTGDPADAYAFRTPSLRNVTRTGPWGHAGAHDDLRAFLLSHLDPDAEWPRPDMPSIGGAEDWRVADDPAEREAIRGAVQGEARPVRADEVDALLAFLAALEDPVALAGRAGIPDRVPSGLAVPR